MQPHQSHSHPHQSHSQPLYYNIKRRLSIKDSPIFKMKAFGQHSLIFTVPEEKCIVWMDYELSSIKHLLRLSEKALAFDSMKVDGRIYLVAGCQNGKIIIRDDLTQKEERPPGQTILQPEFPGEQYINDMLHMPHSPQIVINCYNNGSLAVWDVLEKKRVRTQLKVHDMYTYKLRLHHPNALISCGADGFVNRMDLNKWRQIDSLPHPRAVWCADRIDDCCLASVGLSRRVYVWDVRSKRVSQICQLSQTESSFVTTRQGDPLHLYFGDECLIKRWDRRMAKAQNLSQQTMKQSAEAIVFQGENLWVCGRGAQILQFESSCESVKASPQTIRSLTNIFIVADEKIEEPKNPSIQEDGFDSFDSNEEPGEMEEQEQLQMGQAQMGQVLMADHFELLGAVEQDNEVESEEQINEQGEDGEGLMEEEGIEEDAKNEDWSDEEGDEEDDG